MDCASGPRQFGLAPQDELVETQAVMGFGRHRPADDSQGLLPLYRRKPIAHADPDWHATDSGRSSGAGGRTGNGDRRYRAPPGPLAPDGDRRTGGWGARLRPLRGTWCPLLGSEEIMFGQLGAALPATQPLWNRL
jgi:hypothetical protein